MEVILELSVHFYRNNWIIKQPIICAVSWTNALNIFLKSHNEIKRFACAKADNTKITYKKIFINKKLSVPLQTINVSFYK